MSSTDQNNTLVQLIENYKCSKCKSNHDHRAKCKRKISPYDLSIDTPETKKNRSLNNTQDISISSPWETRRMKSDLVEARSRILMLESQIQQLHFVRKELELAFENEKKALQDQHTKDRDLIHDLESRINVIRRREAETKTELAEVRYKADETKHNLECKIKELQQNIDNLKEEVLDVSSSEHESNFFANQRIAELEDALSAAEGDATAQKKLVAELRSQLSEIKSTKSDVELKEQALKTALVKIKELEYERGSFFEWQAQTKMQQSKLSAFRDLEKEVVKLREENRNLHDAVQNKLLLEEQVLDLQQRLETSKNLHKDIADFEVKYSVLESKLNDWLTLAREYCEPSDPSDGSLFHEFKQVLEQYQRKEIILTSEKSALEADFRATQRDLNNKKQELEKSNTQLLEVQTAHNKQQAFIHRLQKKLLLVSRERDSYRNQLDSYEKELTITLGSETFTSGRSTTELLRERLESCERMIEGYRDLITKLENDLEMTSNQNSPNVAPVRTDQLKRLQSEISQLRAENERIIQQRNDLEKERENHALHENSKIISNLRNEIYELQNQVEILMNQNTELQKQINEKQRNDLEKERENQALQEDIKNISNLRNEIHELQTQVEILTNQNTELQKQINENQKEIKQSGKILHFEQNPFTEATSKYDSEVATLRSEIDRLKRKIRKLEEGIENTRTESFASSSSSQEIQTLKGQITSYELKIQRLREAFKTTSQEFRDVCYILLGYKIDRVSNSNYRLISMYAESPDDYLSFQLNEEGSLNLLETPFSSTLEDLVETHLQHQQSIPLFLSSITVNLFNRLTLRTQTVDL